MQASSRDTTNVFAHFTRNDFVLKIDDLTRYIPVPTFGAGISWECPKYRVTNKVDLYRAGMRTTYRITLSKGSAMAKDWTLINHINSARLPEITVESIAEGLKVIYLPKPGTVMRSAYSYGVGATVELRATPFSTPESFTISFKSHPGFNAPIDFLSLRNDRLLYCADSDSTLQSMSLNGETLPARASVCKKVEGEANDAVYAYRRKFCVDCR